MRKRIAMLIGSVALAAGAIAVASTSAAVTTSNTVPARLAGTWGKTVTLATWRRNGESSEPGGHWAITITKAGLVRMSAPAPVGFFTTMDVSTSGGSLVFGPTADGVCAGKASYTWTVSGPTLALKAVKEGCNPRRVLLTAGTFARRG